MKFMEFYCLVLREEIEFDIIAGGAELDATVAPIELTAEGWAKFKALFDAEIKLHIPPPVAHTITSVEILDDELEQIAQLFVAAQAGYVSETDYDKWFNLDNKTECRSVVKKDEEELLSLGRHRYAVMHNDKTDHMIYAWNDDEAMSRVNFGA